MKVETIGKSDEGRELVVVWVSSDDNIKTLQQNRDNLAKLADPRKITEAESKALIAEGITEHRQTDHGNAWAFYRVETGSGTGVYEGQVPGGASGA